MVSLRKYSLLFFVLALSAFTHLYNPVGFPDLFFDEGVYMRRAMHVLNGLGPQESYFHDHPFFGQLFLASMLYITGYPDSLKPAPDIDSIKMLYSFPRILMGILAIIDTFLIYKIAERKYDRNVAFVASLFFSVMPVTWLLRRILLDSILLPFLLSSILFALHSSKRNLLFSGICLGIAIFTKIPAFAMIPLVAFLVYSSNKNHKSLALWFVPVILIPLIWPAEALYSNQFDLWYRDILYQTSRKSEGFLSIVEFFWLTDPVLFAIGSAGLVLSIIRKDLFALLFIAPFVTFLSTIGYVQYFHWIPVLPVFCIAAATLIMNKRVSKKILLVAVSLIGAFGIVNTTMLITTNISAQFEAAAFVAQYVNDNDTTILASPVYSWIFKYVFYKEHVFLDYSDILFYPIQTKKVLLMTDQHFLFDLPRGKQLENIYHATRPIAIFKGDVLNYDTSRYPYTSMKVNYEGSEIEVRIRE